MSLLSEYVEFKNGKKRPDKAGKYPVYGGNGILNYAADFNMDGGVIIGRVGAYCGNVFLENGKCWVSDNAIKAISKGNISLFYLYYLLKSRNLNDFRIGTSQPLLTQGILNNLEVEIPPLTLQEKIGRLLNAMDKKIELNTQISDNLQQQTQAIYRQMFVDTPNDGRFIRRAEQSFNISIGKTPPRKETQWFSRDVKDITWVSIADMGNCGLYISSSSERLTREAAAKFNIKIVPDNTVLLSFKLTVGRVAITDGEMTTNEAIARFKAERPEISEYLYCYLKNFNYQTMGNTSSIATAVNSKIIKSMPFIEPEENELSKFHELAEPLFMKIKCCQRENCRLSAIRDALLPRLMSGELDVSGLDL